MPQTNGPPKKTPADVMREVRLKVLTTPCSQMGRTPTSEYPHVDAIVMDWPIEKTTVTVMASSVGDASIYTTGTFGVMGGIAFEGVRALAKDFVKLGEKHYPESLPTTGYPYPRSGRIRFYLVCYDEVRVIDTDAQAVANGRDKYSDLFNQAQRVAGELRHIVEKQKSATR